MKTGKRFLASFLAVNMAALSVPFPAGAEQEQTAVPEPYYEFTFDGETTGKQVENEGSKTGVFASISGNGSGLGIIEDETRNSNVLNLPGGGLNQGCLTLPDNMFADVTEEGFAFSFWINIDESANQYSRIFSASSIELNSNDGDNGAWNAPEFTFVAGAEGASDLGSGQSGYHSSIMLPDRSAQLKLVWEEQFTKGEWQHVTVSVSPEAYDVYLDGQNVAMLYDRNNNEKAILTALFADEAAVLKQFTHNAIGRSVYSTDNDLKAKMDEFRFYNTALTAEQAKAAYDSYAVGDSVLAELREKAAEAEEKSISFFTRESYEALETALAEGKAGIENPVTEANVLRLTANLEQALGNLAYYEGVSEETAFSDLQLTRETKEAQMLLAQGSLTEASEQAISAVVEAAEQALAGADSQEAVDQSLAALRTAVDAAEYGSVLRFDADPANNGGPLFHGSTGFLYGVSEINVPTADLLQAISPKILVQKAADGQQHPSGDGYRLTSFLQESGVENIQIYLQDYYLEWPYESNGIDDYNQKVKQIVTKMIAGKTKEELAGYSFVIFNEPDGIWYQNNVAQMCTDWLKIYTTVKEIDPAIQVAGPNFSAYNSSAYQTFFKFCKQNGCLPEYITWHELQKEKLTSFKSHCDEVKGYIDTYYQGSGIDPVIFVNETVDFDDVGNPGALVNWLAVFDEEDVYASLPYWGLANSMNELAADTNKPNGAWWVYKWYAQMTGNKAPLTLENIEAPSAYGRLYGLTSVDENAGIVYSLFGGQAGKQTVRIENIRSTEMFSNAKNAHVKIYSTKYTGHHGFADEIPVEFEGNLAFLGDDLVFTVSDAELMDAYYAVITPATSEENTSVRQYVKEKWEQTHEAEDAVLLGSAKAYTKTNGGDLARSNRAEVGNINSESDGVKFRVNIPKDGRYRLNIYYSSQAPQVDPLTLEYVSSGGQNRAVGALCAHTLRIDGGALQDILYDSTVKWGYYNYKTVYVELTAGEHDIQLMYKGEDQNGKEDNSMLCALLDKIDLTYEPQEPAELVIEPEELAASLSGYAAVWGGSFTGKGAAEGSGSFEFYVNAPRDGYYAVRSTGSGSAVFSKSKVDYAEDAAAESAPAIGWLDLARMELGTQDTVFVYLTAGINRFRVSGSHLTLDQFIFTEAAETTESNSIVTEAEDCQLSGRDMGDSYTYLPGSTAVPEVISTEYASGGKAVEGFRGGLENELKLTVTAPEAGAYKLSVFYSNNEPAPVMKKQDGGNYVHPYNTDLVERYMQVGVNGGTPQTVYFKNTFCWDTYKNTVIDVKLRQGTNVITFTNDNSYKFSALQDDFTPRLDKFVIAPASIIKSADSGNGGSGTDLSGGNGGNPGGGNGGAGSEDALSGQKLQNPIAGISENIKKAYGAKAFTLNASAVGEITYASSDKKVVTVGKTSGKVTIKGCGKATVTITAAGNERYEPGTLKVAVTVTPKKQTVKSLKSSAAGVITVKWKKDKKASGYQIQYSLNKKFKKAKTVTIKKSGTASKKIKKLKAGGKYYVRVRAYKTWGKTKIYGSYSKGKSVKVKK